VYVLARCSPNEEKKKKRRKGKNLEWNLHCNLRERIGNSHIIRCKKLFDATRCSNKQMSSKGGPKVMEIKHMVLSLIPTCTQQIKAAMTVRMYTYILDVY
jgi:hypothetical protein